jgi:hypothetical protein
MEHQRGRNNTVRQGQHLTEVDRLCVPLRRLHSQNWLYPHPFALRPRWRHDQAAQLDASVRRFAFHQQLANSAYAFVKATSTKGWTAACDSHCSTSMLPRSLVLYTDELSIPRRFIDMNLLSASRFRRLSGLQCSLQARFCAISLARRRSTRGPALASIRADPDLFLTSHRLIFSGAAGAG